MKVSEINKLKVKNNASFKVKSEKVSKKNTSGFYCIPWLFKIWFKEFAVGSIKDEVDMYEEDKAMEELYGGDKE